jgi:hypothetical protein
VKQEKSFIHGTLTVGEGSLQMTTSSLSNLVLRKERKLFSVLKTGGLGPML